VTDRKFFNLEPPFITCILYLVASLPNKVGDKGIKKSKRSFLGFSAELNLFPNPLTSFLRLPPTVD
jgi:hypothetical protein